MFHCNSVALLLFVFMQAAGHTRTEGYNQMFFQGLLQPTPGAETG